MKPIKLTDAQMDAALGLEAKVDPEKTGNTKCWHIIDMRTMESGNERMTRTQAESHARLLGRAFRPCRDGYHFEPCPGEAHSNPNIDNCMVCAPRWGVVMVPDKPELTHAEKTLLGALK